LKFVYAVKVIQYFDVLAGPVFLVLRSIAWLLHGDGDSGDSGDSGGDGDDSDADGCVGVVVRATVFVGGVMAVAKNTLGMTAELVAPSSMYSHLLAILGRREIHTSRFSHTYQYLHPLHFTDFLLTTEPKVLISYKFTMSTSWKATVQIPYVHGRPGHMMEAWRKDRAMGLYEFLIKECKNGTGAKWEEKVLDDHKGEKRVLKMILRLSEDVIESLIDGTLGVKTCDQQWYTANLHPPELTPGVYINIMLIRRASGARTWLTARETTRFLTILEQYGKKQQNDMVSIAIDEEIVTGTWEIRDTARGWRRWIDSDNGSSKGPRKKSNEPLNKFIESIRENRLNSVNEICKDTPQLSAPMEVG
jgi:hypothetical protein